jgi:FKBP-type peptidyl-prolyl cis-trans isomerase
MKKTLTYLLLAALVLSGCAKTATSGLNDASKRYFDAWIHVNYPGLAPTALGAYVIEEEEGTGAALQDAETDAYVRLNYTVRSLDGTVSGTTYPYLAKQLGEYSETEWYGPVIWSRADGSLYAGVDEMLSSMKIGGKKKTVIPGWLLTGSRYDTAQEYIDNVSGGSPAIYELELLEAISDTDQWELDSIGRYLASNFPEVSLADSLKYGFYYIQKKAPQPIGTSSDDDDDEEESDAGFPRDSTIYINYTGRLLNGQVFDTTIEDTAKVYGLYSSSNSYEPISVNYNYEDYSQITITSDKSSVIDGFAYMIWRMGAYEEGTGIFYSKLGYSYSGSGSSIPAYSPLRFDIEVVDQP